MNRSPECERECQYAKDNACPEYSCKPACQYLLHGQPELLPIPIPVNMDFDLKIDSGGQLDLGPDFWKWDPKFDTEEYHQMMIKKLGLSPSFFDAWSREPEYGSALYGPLVTDKVVREVEVVLKGLTERAKSIGDYEVGEASLWRCVATSFDKKRRTLTQEWKCLTDVGYRSVVKRVWRRTPARLFKKLIGRNRRHLGSETMEMDLVVKPVKPVEFVYLTCIITPEGVSFPPMTDHKIDPVWEQTEDGPRISYINLGPKDGSA